MTEKFNLDEAGPEYARLVIEQEFGVICEGYEPTDSHTRSARIREIYSGWESSKYATLEHWLSIEEYVDNQLADLGL